MTDKPDKEGINLRLSAVSPESLETIVRSAAPQFQTRIVQVKARVITRYGHVSHIHTSAPDPQGNTYLLLTKVYSIPGDDKVLTNAELLRRSPVGALELLHVFAQDKRALALGLPWSYALNVPITIVGKQAFGSVQPKPHGGLWVDLSTRVPTGYDSYGERQAWMEIEL